VSEVRVKGSFRDPSGFILVQGGELFRRVNRVYQEHYDLLMSSGLYDALVESALLVRHNEVSLGLPRSADLYKVIKPEVIPFVSYPYEWCFSQLKDAALITLQVQKKALEFGMTLKDASAYNIQFLKGRPIFIDTLSFEKYQEGEPWVAYRQFCQHFLAPLALMGYRHIGLGQLSRIYIDGVPLDLASTVLPMRTRLKPWMQIHIHLHAKFQKNFAGKAKFKTRSKGGFGLWAHLGLIDSLESVVRNLRWRPAGTEWTEYYEGDSYTPEALNHKVELVTRFLQEVKPRTVWDMGANTGLYSRIASDMGINTISFDKDPAAVDKNYLTVVRRGETEILPLLLDLTNPSPRLGWANGERMDLIERGPTDMLFATALIHHLVISENVPLGMVAEFFGKLCRWAVIEFVPKSDKKVVGLLATRRDIFPDHTQEGFEREFSGFFDIKSVNRIKDSERTLYLMRSNAQRA
jgi:hypothetical protein